MNINSNDSLLGDNGLPEGLENGFVMYDRVTFTLRGYFFTIMGSFGDIYTIEVQSLTRNQDPKKMEMEVCHSEIMDFEIGFMLDRMVVEKKYKVRENAVGEPEILMDVYLIKSDVIQKLSTLSSENVTYRSAHGIDRAYHRINDNEDYCINMIVSDELFVPVMLNMSASLHELRFIYNLRCSDVGHEVSSKLLDTIYVEYILKVFYSLQEYINPSKQMEVNFRPYFVYGRSADMFSISAIFIPQGINGVPIFKTNPMEMVTLYNEMIYPYIEALHPDLPEEVTDKVPNLLDVIPYLYSTTDCIPYVYGYKDPTDITTNEVGLKSAKLGLLTKFILYVKKGNESKIKEWMTDKKYAKSIIPFYEFSQFDSKFAIKEMQIELPIKLFKRKEDNKIISFFKKVKFPIFAGRVQSEHDRINVTHDVISLALQNQPSAPKGDVVVHYVDEKYTHFIILPEEKAGNISSHRTDKKGEER